MRFGWLAAAAAMVCASQAGAVTFVKYTFSGSGTITPLNPNTGLFSGPARSTDFQGSFSVIVDPIETFGSQRFYSDGLVFRVEETYANERIDGSRSGILTGTYASAFPGGGGADAGITVNYPDLDAAGGLPRATGAGAVSGSFFYAPSVFSLSGRITSFGVFGTTDNYIPLFAIAVPEPASWAMMIGGVGLIGAAARRKRPVPAIA